MEIKKSKDEKKKELELYSYAAPPKGIEEGNGRDYFESIKGVCSDNVATLLISVLLAAVSTYVSWSARVLTPNIEVEGNFSPGSIYAAAAAVVAALSIPMLLQIQSNLQEIDSLDLSNHSGGNLAGRGHSINGGSREDLIKILFRSRNRISQGWILLFLALIFSGLFLSIILPHGGKSTADMWLAISINYFVNVLILFQWVASLFSLKGLISAERILWLEWPSRLQYRWAQRALFWEAQSVVELKARRIVRGHSCTVSSVGAILGYVLLIFLVGYPLNEEGEGVSRAGKIGVIIASIIIFPSYFWLFLRSASYASSVWVAQGLVFRSLNRDGLVVRVNPLGRDGYIFRRALPSFLMFLMVFAILAVSVFNFALFGLSVAEEEAYDFVIGLGIIALLAMLSILLNIHLFVRAKVLNDFSNSLERSEGESDVTGSCALVRWLQKESLKIALE